MNTVVTSKEEILKTSRELIQQAGWSAVNIRSVATACGVSVGSIYNYFDSKAALMGATVESVWCEIFHRPEDEARIPRPVLPGCTNGWSTAANGIPDFSVFTRWASWGRINPMENGGCSRPGSIF